ncbi:hypothetical protein L914_11549 [Phytophthora nicotianae]|uniref:Uncharacterized protein n=2 Tax=Phytophthora nicotianae TaxID=4792 RepID=W2N2I3_PHYNI|nr:hypothetical protein L914_11549 [Phytophthora nicotianae]ETO71600.1 hypothetical protein F444_12101 [Phytophthora nicotianae P1976]
MCTHFIRWPRPMTRCRRERGAPSAPKHASVRQRRQDADCQKSIRAVCPSCVRCLALQVPHWLSDVTMIEWTTLHAAPQDRRHGCRQTGPACIVFLRNRDRCQIS